jgi:hypothetical protein
VVQPQQPAPAQQSTATLGDLVRGAVDFKGRTIEPKHEQHPDASDDAPIAEGTSIRFTRDDDLKELIARALGKK